MPKRQLDASWRSWLTENIERQCDPEELFCILVKNDFSLRSIQESMGDYDPTRIARPEPADRASISIDYKAISEVRLTDPQKCPQAQRFLSDLIQLYTIDDFMSDEECNSVCDIICRNLHPSTTTDAEREPDKSFRTSSTCELGWSKDNIIDLIDERIARTLGISRSYSEAMQGHYYSIGQEFKQHTDFFEPGTEVYARYCAEAGNRTWTFMIYLNDVVRGGGTHFINLNHTFQPKKGTALIWNNLHANGAPNYAAFHAGLPVQEGQKVIITKWFRELGSGPMLSPE